MRTVRCKDNKGALVPLNGEQIKALTVGKDYEVLGFEHGRVKVICDNGQPGWWLIERFEIAPRIPLRLKILSAILIAVYLAVITYMALC